MAGSFLERPAIHTRKLDVVGLVSKADDAQHQYLVNDSDALHQ